jgi:hypothetical protein
MSKNTGTLDSLINHIRRKAPEYLDLFSAQSEAEFDAALDGLLERAVSHLEKNKANFQTLNEEGLTAVLVASLTIPGLTVTQETHSNGHVDVTIEADHCMPARRKLGEAKIYRGYSYHVSGLKQLLGRYTTGRESRGLLIVYFRKPEVRRFVAQLQQQMDMNRPMNQTAESKSHTLKWSFCTEHIHSSGESLEVEHIGCNLYIEDSS